MPCEKFIRAISIPALRIESMVSSEEEAGPIVQTILVFFLF